MNPMKNSMYDEYEPQLSPFGRKVMICLLKFKEERRNISNKTFYPPPVPRYQNRQVLRFNNLSPPKSQASSSDKAEQTISIEHNIKNVGAERESQTDRTQHVSTALGLLTTGHFKSTLTADEPVQSADQQISPQRDAAGDSTDIEIGSEHMLDVDYLFKCGEGNTLRDAVPHDAVGKPGADQHPEGSQVGPKHTMKRKDGRNIEASEEKRHKANDTENDKKTYRKEKYTTTVRNWLKEVRPIHGEDEGRAAGAGGEKHAQGKKIRGMVQCRLQNKGGVMRYGRQDGREEHTHGEEQGTADQLDKSTGTVIRERKSKKKFVAPIKSQVPVEDVTYPLKIFDDASCKELEDADLVNEEIFITLIFSNGSCQLGGRPAHAACSADGLMACVGETFHYFKGSSGVPPALEKIMSSNRIICYDAKTILKYLFSFGRDVQLFQFSDVKIAGHLVGPGKCPGTFSELCERVSATPRYTVAAECPLQRAAWHVTLMKAAWETLKTSMTHDGLYEFFVGTEMKLLPILADMERRGVCVDGDRLEAMGQAVKTRMEEVEEECYRAAGRSFQINSAPQLRAILYGDLRLDQTCDVTVRKTAARGDKSTSEHVLRLLMPLHPLPGLILEYRHLHKAHSTFITGVAHHVVDGVVKPTWDQAAAVTGRISSSNPNLQAIPKTFNLAPCSRADAGPEPLRFRSVYRGRAGWRLVAADFKQVECRVLAHVARDEHLEQALRSDDLFADLAARWLQKPVSAVSGGDRERTKRLVYAGLYGAGARTLADILQAPRGQLQEIIHSFDRTFPSLKRFCKGVWSDCSRGGGRVSTVGGRTGTFPNISCDDAAMRAQAQRQAVNFIIQGSAAELCKRAMCECVSRLRQAGVSGRLLLAVHDELVWEVSPDEVPRAAEIIKRSMENCGRQLGLRVPLPVALYTGDNWGELEQYTPAGWQ